MKCSNCGKENEDNAKFCKSCGESLQISKTPTNINSNPKSSNHLLIICVTVILCVAIIAGAFILLNNGSNDSSSSNNAVSSASSEDSISNDNNMRIINGTIASGYTTDGRTVCTVYVGTEHANEHVQISVLFKKYGSALNEGKIVPTTVTDEGLVIVKSADILDELPNSAEINLYDENGNLIDNRIEKLNDESGWTDF